MAQLAITVRGRTGTYTFHFKGDPACLDEWRAEGLDVVEVVNTIPVWVVDLGLTCVWCRAQDLWRLMW